jgi:hypothetical protein
MKFYWFLFIHAEQSPWRTVFLQKLVVPQLFKKFPALNATLKIYYHIHKSRHLFLSQGRSLQSTSHFFKTHFNIILSTPKYSK